MATIAESIKAEMEKNNAEKQANLAAREIELQSSGKLVKAEKLVPKPASKKKKAAIPKKKNKAVVLKKAAVNDASLVLKNLIAIPKKSGDDDVFIKFGNDGLHFKPGEVVPNIDISKIESIPGEMQKALFFLLNRKAPKGYRRVLNASSYTGGVRLALCKLPEKSTSISCVISNTNSKFTFQRQGDALALESIAKLASDMDFSERERPKAPKAWSYTQYYLRKAALNNKLIAAALKLLK